ncbi:hypothetical protein [uncultured Pseudoxanthomonas sp.]|uniref:hypothetical protein n=1 Tax=uncultured Pseudoxanthomonas sp. TaxID=281701 RepID=UPI002616469D|nr:hypothetical protein [uncultured Pseudoxanthomonas sp.]
MNRRFPCYCLIVASLLIAGCWGASEFKPPTVKTNSNPTQRYEITVELVDPPVDIENISGMAYFSIPDVICMPTPDRIAGYTPGSRYERGFSLVPTGNNTYRGHIFLDWPIDEDYYGLGLCKWEFAYADAIVERGSTLRQTTRLSLAELNGKEVTVGYCRTLMRDKYDSTCFTPFDDGRIQELDPISYKMKISSRKN